MIPKNLIKKTPSIENHNWKKVGERRSNSVLNRDLYAKGFGQKYIREMTGIDFGCKNLLFVNPELYLDVDEFAVFRDKFLENVRNDPEYYPLVVSRFRAYCDALKDLAYEIKEKDFSKAENADLKKQFERIMSALLDIMPFSYINHNQEEIPNILLEEVLIKAGVDKSRISEYKPKLIVPTDELTFSQQEAGALKELAEKLNKDNQKELIRQHIEEYGWIKSSYFNARQATEQEILERIKNINQAQEKHKENDPVLKELNIDENQLKVVNCLKELLFLKTYRKELIGLISFASKGLFDEIAKRMDVSYEHVINHTVDEIREFFASGKVNKDEIHKRLESFAHVLVDGHSKVITGSVLLEKYAEKGISQDITGQTANSGKVKGNVVVIEKQQDLKNIKQGSIVVIDSIGPTDFQHVSKAAGIITNHGGVLSHAALLARELNIPCIIGAENATQALEQGEYIELDADNGTVNKLEDKYRKMFTITMGLCLADLYMRTHVFNTREVLGKGHRNICFMIRDGKLSGYFSEEDIEEMGRLGVEKLKDNEFVQKNKSECRDLCGKLSDLSEYINSLDLKHMEIRELLRLFNLLFSKIREMYGYFNVSQPGISFALEKEIAKELEKMGISGLKQHEILEKLLIQEGATLVEEEESGLLDLAMIIRKNNALKQLFENEDEHILKELPRMSRTIGSVRSFNDKLDLHILRYSYLASYEDFDLFYKKYYINRIKHIIDFEDHILDKKKKALFPVKKEVEEARNKVYEENKIPKHLRHLINVAGYYSHQRMHIRTYFVKGVSVLGRFYDEFAHRMNIGPREARYLMNEEINAFFLENKPVDKQEVLKRMQLSIYRIKDDVPALFAGKEAEEFEEKYLPKEDLDVTELKGTIANKGYKKGRVKVLELGKNIAKQIDEMKRGDILVAGNTRPEVIVACQKASAIVTDEGGILSHAALVSREFGIPCIVSTYKATRVFKTGDLVEVDANNGVVRKL